MPGLIRRTLLIGGAAAAVAAATLYWRARSHGATEVAYGAGPRQVLDVTLPNGDGPFPVLVMIHGHWKIWSRRRVMIFTRN